MKNFLVLLSIIMGFGLLGNFLLSKQTSLLKVDLPGREQTPTPRLVNPAVPENQFSVWLGYWDEEKIIVSLTNNVGSFKTISPMWYRLNEKGEVTVIPNATKKQEIMELATINKIGVVPTLTNEFDPQKISTLFNNEDLKQKQIDLLVDEAILKGYSGWDIDFEEIYPGDKIGFSDFVNELASQLHAKKLILGVTLQAKTGSKSDRPTTGAQDWPVLVKSADYIRIMAYDFHSETSESGPVTPLDDLESVIKYAVSVISLDKLVLGLPTYGYDWVGNKGTSVSYDEVNILIKQNKGDFRRDNLSQALVGKYRKNGINHVLWFEDSSSVKTKINIGRSYGIYQYVFWSIGGEDQNIWKE